MHSPIHFAFLAALTLCLASCASNVRLEVQEGQIFRLTESADPGPEVISFVDKRESIQRKSARQPLEISIGEEELEPKPLVALRSEIGYLRTLRDQTGKKAMRLEGKSLVLEDFQFTVKAADVSKPREARQDQPPARDVFGDAVRSMAQSVGGGSDVFVEFRMVVDGQTVLGKGQYRTTASPGNVASTRAFRRAVVSALSQLPEGQ